MIRRGGRELDALYVGRRAVAAVYRGARLVWEAVRSCFGRGWWDDERPWSDNDAWQD